MLRATLIASLALVISLVASALVLSRAYVTRGEQPFTHGRTLAVTGSAKSRIRSDLAVWKIRVSGEGPTLQAAYDSLRTAERVVSDFLLRRGFQDTQLGPIDTRTYYRHTEEGQATRDVIAHVLKRTFRVTSKDVDAVAKAAGEVTELIQTGSLVESEAPEFVYTKIAGLKIRMIGEATANARERATAIAEGSGCAIGETKEARAGVLQITAPWSTEVASYGIHDTHTIDKDVTAVVHLRFHIVR
ncbi:MAG: SIMPL domain-containing protein [Planctomycetota bacterium]|jgi:hypothetical protein